jgi:HEPN domain-containing protein
MMVEKAVRKPKIKFADSHMRKDRKFGVNDGFKSEELFQNALDHLASSKLLFDRNPRCYDSAGYLAHLGLELMLKSVLLNLKGEFPAEHDLKKLYNFAKRLGAVLLKKSEQEELERINQFFYLRYTNHRKPIEIGDDDWEPIKQLFYTLSSNFSKDTINKSRNPDYYKKGGRVLYCRPKKQINLIL